MRCAIFSALLVTLGLPAFAQTPPALTPISGPCAAMQVQSLPYVSVQGSALTAISFTNPSSDTIVNVQACAYDQQGNPLGATAFQLAPNSWFIAANGPGNGWLDLSQLFNGASLPGRAPFNSVIASDQVVQIQGIVSNPALGARVIVQSAAMPGTMIASNSLGLQTMDQGYIFLADPTATATTANIDLLYSDGTIVTGLGNIAIPGFGSTVASISDLLSASGATGGQGLFAVRATSQVSGATLDAWSVLARISDSGGSYVVTLPLQVVQP